MQEVYRYLQVINVEFTNSNSSSNGNNDDHDHHNVNVNHNHNVEDKKFDSFVKSS